MPRGVQPKKNLSFWASLVVQWLRRCTCNAWGPILVPGQRIRSYMLQLKVCILQLDSTMPQLKILHAAMKIPQATNKTKHGQINIYFLKISNKVPSQVLWAILANHQPEEGVVESLNLKSVRSRGSSGLNSWQLKWRQTCGTELF